MSISCLFEIFRTHTREHSSHSACKPLMSEIWIGCVRIPDVPAWAFRWVKDAEDPFVVVEQGRVVGASRTPRGKGVETGMTRLRARSLCETTTTRPRDANAEKTAWERLLQSLNAQTPRIESERPGLAWIEPLDGDSLREWLDEKQCHCGVASNRSVALLAAWKATPGRIICIEDRYEASFLSRTPTDALSEVGFSEEIVERLSLFGYENVESLKALTKRHLSAQFGEEGGRLYEFLHPDVSRVSFYSPPPTVRVSRDFERDVREPGPLQEALEEMSEALHGRLDGKACQHLSVRLTGRHENQEASRILREPVARSSPIYRAASILLKRALKAGISVRTLEVKARALRSASGTQGHLFRNRPALKSAIATIQEKHSDTLYRVDQNEGAVFEEDRFTYEPVAVGP